MTRIFITLSAPLFYFFFFSLLSHQTMSQPEHVHTFCNPIENYTQTSSYETNRDTLRSSLRESSSLGTYSNATVGLSPDTAYGMFLCRGDIDATSCSVCVQAATIRIATRCSLNKRAVIYYQECTVRYSNVNFFSQLEIGPRIVIYSLRSAPNLNRFNQTLSDKFEQLLPNLSSSTLVPYFVKDQERVTQVEGSFELESSVQCSPDLDLATCIVCLRIAFIRVSTCCGLPRSAQLFTPKCLLSSCTYPVQPYHMMFGMNLAAQGTTTSPALQACPMMFGTNVAAQCTTPAVRVYPFDGLINLPFPHLQ